MLRSASHWPVRLAMTPIQREKTVRDAVCLFKEEEQKKLPELPPRVIRRAPALNSKTPTLAVPPMLFTWEKALKKLFTANSTSVRKFSMEPDSSKTSTMLAEHCLEKVGLAAPTQVGQASHTVPLGSHVLKQHCARAVATRVASKRIIL